MEGSSAAEARRSSKPRTVRLQHQLFAEVAGDVKATDELQQRRAAARAPAMAAARLREAGRGPAAATPAAALQKTCDAGRGDRRRSARARGTTMAWRGDEQRRWRRRRLGSGNGAVARCRTDRSLTEGCDSTKFDDEMEIPVLIGARDFGRLYLTARGRGPTSTCDFDILLYFWEMGDWIDTVLVYITA
ncbi:hypothetical protein Scep_009810 [Stephania cephalantha]|uniref:Uncharacterized protein n=1 Tax=Stephania cephalantha TaxID=152367 RepID=A0AAP0JUJ5_9MAGN